ncbi:MAG TPA: hypothetical protein VGK65_04910, partial [Candidatus Binatia bacterium]
RNISRKGAKHVLSNVEGAAKKLNFRTWRSWRPFDFAQDRLGASKSHFWESHGPPEDLRERRKLLRVAIQSSESRAPGFKHQLSLILPLFCAPLRSLR